MRITTVNDLRKALELGSYVDGGYPVFFWTDNGRVYAPQTVCDHIKSVVNALRNPHDAALANWRLAGVDINWENAALCDDETCELLESAYPATDV